MRVVSHPPAYRVRAKCLAVGVWWYRPGTWVGSQSGTGTAGGDDGLFRHRPARGHISQHRTPLAGRLVALRLQDVGNNRRGLPLWGTATCRLPPWHHQQGVGITPSSHTCNPWAFLLLNLGCAACVCGRGQNLDMMPWIGITRLTRQPRRRQRYTVQIAMSTNVLGSGIVVVVPMKIPSLP